MNTAGRAQPRRHPEGSVVTAVVSALMDLGHADEVRRLGDEGDWGCASAWASAAAARGEFEEALAMLGPFAETGWWPAVVARDRVAADARADPEEREQATAPVWPPDEAREFTAERVSDQAATLAAAGRVAEAVEILHEAALLEGGYPHTALPTLVGMTAEHGLHDQVLAIIDDIAHRTGGMTVGLWERRAAVLALRGDADQALRELTALDEDTAQAPWLRTLHLARIMTDVGLLEEAATRLATLDDPAAMVQRATLLIRLGRVAEAIEIARWRPPAGRTVVTAPAP